MAGRPKLNQEQREALSTKYYPKVLSLVEGGASISDACVSVKISRTRFYKTLFQSQKDRLMKEKKKWSSRVLRFKNQTT